MAIGPWVAGLRGALNFSGAGLGVWEVCDSICPSGPSVTSAVQSLDGTSWESGTVPSVGPSQDHSGPAELFLTVPLSTLSVLDSFVVKH